MRPVNIICISVNFLISPFYHGAQYERLFRQIDTNGDSEISQIEFIKALRRYRFCNHVCRYGDTRWPAFCPEQLGRPMPLIESEVFPASTSGLTILSSVCAIISDSQLAERLNLPDEIRQEGESRRLFQMRFHEIDVDGSKTITLDEWLHFYVPPPDEGLQPPSPPPQQETSSNDHGRFAAAGMTGLLDSAAHVLPATEAMASLASESKSRRHGLVHNGVAVARGHSNWNQRATPPQAGSNCRTAADAGCQRQRLQELMSLLNTTEAQNHDQGSGSGRTESTADRFVLNVSSSLRGALQPNDNVARMLDLELTSVRSSGSPSSAMPSCSSVASPHERRSRLNEPCDTASQAEIHEARGNFSNLCTPRMMEKLESPSGRAAGRSSVPLPLTVSDLGSDSAHQEAKIAESTGTLAAPQAQASSYLDSSRPDAGAGQSPHSVMLSYFQSARIHKSATRHAEDKLIPRCSAGSRMPSLLPESPSSVRESPRKDVQPGGLSRHIKILDSPPRPRTLEEVVEEEGCETHGALKAADKVSSSTFAADPVPPEKKGLRHGMLGMWRPSSSSSSSLRSLPSLKSATQASSTRAQANLGQDAVAHQPGHLERSDTGLMRSDTGLTRSNTHQLMEEGGGAGGLHPSQEAGDGEVDPHAMCNKVDPQQFQVALLSVPSSSITRDSGAGGGGGSGGRDSCEGNGDASRDEAGGQGVTRDRMSSSSEADAGRANIGGSRGALPEGSAVPSPLNFVLGADVVCVSSLHKTKLRQQHADAKSATTSPTSARAHRGGGRESGAFDECPASSMMMSQSASPSPAVSPPPKRSPVPMTPYSSLQAAGFLSLKQGEGSRSPIEDGTTSGTSNGGNSHMEEGRIPSGAAADYPRVMMTSSITTRDSDTAHTSVPASRPSSVFSVTGTHGQLYSPGRIDRCLYEDGRNGGMRIEDGRGGGRRSGGDTAVSDALLSAGGGPLAMGMRDWLGLEECVALS